MEVFMAIAASKRSVMTLFSCSTDMLSHQVRIVLAEKGVSVEIESINPENPPQELKELGTPCSVPTLIDRDLTLYLPHVITEYLDERFPHPPLMPVYPVARAQSRLMMHHIENNWYSLLKKIKEGNEQEADTTRKNLRAQLLEGTSLIKPNGYFMGDDFSLVDCQLAPLLWRLAELKIVLNGEDAKQIRGYMGRVFQRDGFLASLSEAERDMYPTENKIHTVVG
ncbi:stringent starvation protein A [Candidatus Regiella insecticola LSR1]|uniref:Stringent starvation protein A n=2 Tax=Candidatus Regiella insecticola TaxID=138073 RepID=E0WQR7_9ENTR|nr:stringent starvation protein A [Candidatus Regiella insecticola LSR1]